MIRRRTKENRDARFSFNLEIVSPTQFLAYSPVGEVQCYGTPMFLKSEFGSGYSLTLSQEEVCDVDGTTALVTSVVRDSSMTSNAPGQSIYRLPDQESKSFPRLFEQLETQKERLGIRNFGISVTTMEDVFIEYVWRI